MSLKIKLNCLRTNNSFFSLLEDKQNFKFREFDKSKIHSFLIHFSDLFLLYNCLFLFRNMKILPNLYFADFYRRNGSSSKYTEAIFGQVAGSRQTLEVATSNPYNIFEVTTENSGRD